MNWFPVYFVICAVASLVVCRLFAGVKLRDRLQRKAFNDRFDQ